MIINPLIAVYLWGIASFAQIGALPVLCLMSGGGKVLIRETAPIVRLATTYGYIPR